MNNANTQQPKKLNRTQILKSKGMIYEAEMLLTNGGMAPIPSKFLNQRQRRKRAAQMR